MTSPDTLPAIGNCRFVDLPAMSDRRGELCLAEAGGAVPFAIERVFWMFDVPAGTTRGAHAHRHVEVVLLVPCGAVDVLLDDGRVRQTVRMDDPRRGLYIGAWIWHELVDFAANTTCLVLASGRYDEADYIRDHDEFRRLVGQRRDAA